MKKFFAWVWAQICAAYNWIIAQLDKVRKDLLYSFITGILGAAFCAIVLKVEWVWWPILMVAFIREFIPLFCGRSFRVSNFLSALIGGLLIWGFQLIS